MEEVHSISQPQIEIKASYDDLVDYYDYKNKENLDSLFKKNILFKKALEVE